MKHPDSHNKTIGQKGEDAACMFLVKRNFKIVDRNYLRKWGEIDIVAEKAGRTHFVEVKTVSRESLNNVTHVTNDHKPEDNVHFRKQQRLSRVFQTYLIDKQKEEVEWQFDLITVYLCPNENRVRVHIMEDVII